MGEQVSSVPAVLQANDFSEELQYEVMGRKRGILALPITPHPLCLLRIRQLDNMQMFIFQKVCYSLFLLPLNILKLPLSPLPPSLASSLPDRPAAVVTCWRLGSQHAPLQLAGHHLPLLLQFSSQTLKLQLLRGRGTSTCDVSKRVGV